MQAVTLDRRATHTSRRPHFRRYFQAAALAVVTAVIGPLGARAQSVFDVDLDHSRVFVFVGKSGLGHEHGVEGQLRRGRVSLGPAQDAGLLEFDMKSFRADTEAARKYVGLSGTTSDSTKRQVNDNMLGAKVLDVNRYPTAKLEIASLKKLAGTSRNGHPMYEMKGRFTLHGRAHDIRVITELIQEQTGPRLRGGFRILQSDYGIKPFTKAFGAIGVADELRIYGELRLKQPRAAQAPRSNGGIR